MDAPQLLALQFTLSLLAYAALALWFGPRRVWCNRILLVAIVVVGSPAIAGWLGTEIAQPGVSKVYHGHYTFRREVSAFKPCDLDERWWVDAGSEALREHLTAPDGSVGGERYVEVEGIVSERGPSGHLGAYDRKLEIQKVLLVEFPRKTCSQ